ncbi:MAG: asparagine synthase (glutamine-hydrolyzing), partial [Noviherbaspirillum sp.]
MCGITGFLDPSRQSGTRAASLEAALSSLRHRGPDHAATWLADPAAGLAHSRLSILDVSEHGHQPMHSADGRLVMVFNGEVYNFAALRQELEPLGHRFCGSGDSEVVLAAISEWGMERALRRFIGMFALAVWDRREQRLTLARDRLGVKPLYHGWSGKLYWFGSELKALRAFGHQPEIDNAALAEYFQFGYIDAPRSIYRGIAKLPPGHLLQIGPDGQHEMRCWWSVLDALEKPLAGSETDLADALEELLQDAFRLRMVSDVPVGVFLSGGIDSSVLAALLQKGGGPPIHTFTIGFSDARHDESGHARRVAEHLGAIHTERILETADARRILPLWGRLYDEPFFDSSGIPTYLVSKVASEQVKVVLSADGGDELFSGYEAYEGMLRRVARRERMPAPLLRTLQALLPRMPLDAMDDALNAAPLPPAARLWLRRRAPWRARQAREQLCAATPGAGYENQFSIWDPAEIAALTGSYARVRETADAWPGSFAEQMCLWDLHHYLPGDILAKVDRATMAASIEGREPLLDHRIVEFALRLPLSLRRGQLGSKHLLRRVLYRHVPRELVDRPKMGFAIPLLAWLRGDLQGMVREYLDPALIRDQGLLDPGLVARTLRAFTNGDDYSADKVWTLLAFQMWHREWMVDRVPGREALAEAA